MSHSLRTIFSIIATFSLLVGVFTLYFNHVRQEAAAEKAADIRKSLSALNEKTPLLVNPKLNLYLIRASFEENNGVLYEYKFVELKKHDMSSTELEKRKIEFTTSYCENIHKYIFEEFGGVEFRYLSQDNVELLALKPHPTDCHV